MVRLTRWPPSSVCQPFSRAARTRSAIISIAVSRSRSSQSVAYGRRYLTVVTRVGLVTRDKLALPLGHSRPRLIGESGSPSIWTIFSSLTNTRCPQPTAQYGQTDFTTLSAVAVRLTTCSVALLRAAVPRPSGSDPVSCRNTGHASSHVFTQRSLPSRRLPRRSGRDGTRRSAGRGEDPGQLTRQRGQPVALWEGDGLRCLVEDAQGADHRVVDDQRSTGVRTHARPASVGPRVPDE